MLTRKQLVLLDFIQKRVTRDGVPPSFDEMKEALDLRSKSGIHRLITALEERRVFFKSMGATSGQIRRIFILEGLGVGLGGAVLGSGLGTGFCYLAKNLIVPGETFGGQQATIVPMQFDVTYVLIASFVALAMGLLSSVVPAHRAARLHPVEAIRRG